MTAVTNARGAQLFYSAASLHHFSATHAGPLLEGTGEADSFWGDSDVTTTLSGGLGDDIQHTAIMRATRDQLRNFSSCARSRRAAAPLCTDSSMAISRRCRHR